MSMSVWIANRSFSQNNRAVSPVVAVILMVALTIVVSASVGAVAFSEYDGIEENYEQFEEVLEGEEEIQQLAFTSYDLDMELTGRDSWGHEMVYFESSIETEGDESIEGVDEMVMTVEEGQEELSIRGDNRDNYIIRINGEEVEFNSIEYSDPDDGEHFSNRLSAYYVATFELDGETTINPDDEITIDSLEADGIGRFYTNSEDGTAVVETTFRGDKDISIATETGWE